MAFSHFRDKIDDIDSKILELLNQRAGLAKELVSEKRLRGLPVVDQGRESKVVQRLRDLNQGPLTDDMIEKVFVNFFSVFRQLQHDEMGLMDLKQGPKELIGKKVGIVGVGLMGGSVAKALSTYLPKVPVFVFDPKITGTTWNSYQVGTSNDLLTCDLIVLGMPVRGIREFLKTKGQQLQPGTVLVDLGSTKGEIMGWASEFLQPGVEFIGGHPLVGKEVGGFENSHENLYRDEIFTLSPAAKVQPKNLAMVEALIKVLGARSVIVAAEQHDKILGLTSHLPHLLCLALAKVETQFQAQRADRNCLVPRSYREMARLAASNPSIWGDILLSNQKNLVELLNKYLDQLEVFRDLLKSDDQQAVDRARSLFEQAFEESAEYYEEISKKN